MVIKYIKIANTFLVSPLLHVKDQNNDLSKLNFQILIIQIKNIIIQLNFYHHRKLSRNYN